MLRILVTALLLALSGSAWAERPELQIEVTGVTGEMLDNVRNHLGLYAQRDHPLLSESLIRRLHAMAPDDIRRALEPFGHYAPRIDGELIETQALWIARYRIDPGVPVRIGGIRIGITGAAEDDPAFTRWRERFPIAEGDILDHRVYEHAKQSLTRLARERGYFDGELTSQRVTVDLEAYEAVVELAFASGPRYLFGEVAMEHDKFSPDFLRRFRRFEPGDPYDANKLLALRRDLADADYFDRADVLSVVERAEDLRVPIEVDLDPKADNRYSAGVGYSTDTGPRARVGYERRRANRYGHRWSLSAQQSEIESSVIARYRVPLGKPRTDYLTYSAVWLDEDTDTVERTTTSVGADVTQQIGPWLRTTGVVFEEERYRVDIQNDSSLVIPHIRFQRLGAVTRVDPDRGWIVTLGVRGAWDEVFSDTSFIQPRADGKLILPITPRSRLLLRGSAAFSWVPEFQELPVSQRFFAGGDRSIRGFAYESLGPRNEDGVVIGGRHLLVASAELERHLRGRMAGAVFIDAGNAFTGSTFEVEQGAGVGLRWSTPIGAIRVDVAHALTGPGNAWRLHLTFGPDL